MDPDSVPYFPIFHFVAHEKKYDEQKEKTCWKDWTAINKLCVSMEKNPATIIGHIDAETAKQWFDWPMGQLFVVAFRGSSFFCATAGLIVASVPPMD